MRKCNNSLLSVNKNWSENILLGRLPVPAEFTKLEEKYVEILVLISIEVFHFKLYKNKLHFKNMLNTT